MEYKITTKDDIDILMTARLEMIRKLNGLSDDYQFSNEFIEKSKNYFLEGNQTTVLAIQDGIAVGCASISYIEIMPTLSHPTGKRAHFVNVYTKADYRRKGIARKLVRMLIDEAKEKGVTEISLDATDLGKVLYESLGFCKSDECMVMNLIK